MNEFDFRMIDHGWKPFGTHDRDVLSGYKMFMPDNFGMEICVPKHIGVIHVEKRPKLNRFRNHSNAHLKNLWMVLRMRWRKDNYTFLLKKARKIIKSRNKLYGNSKSRK